MHFVTDYPQNSGYYWMLDTNSGCKVVYVYQDKYYTINGYSDELDSKYSRAFIFWGDKIEPPLEYTYG